MSDSGKPTSSQTGDEQEEDRPGYEKRTRRVRRKRKRDHKEESRNLLDQGKDLLEKMQASEDQGSAGHVGVKEQVRRLQDRDEDDKDLDEVWGTKKRSNNWLWVSLIGLIIPLVGIGIVLKFFTIKGDRDTVDADELEIVLPTIEETVTSQGVNAWFYANSMAYLKQAQEILAQFNEGNGLSVKAVRPPARADLNPVRATIWDSPAKTSNINWIKWVLDSVPSASGIGEQGYMTLQGKLEDQTPFRAYFLPKGEDGLVLDWDATTGWGEADFESLRAERPSRPKLVRARLYKRPALDTTVGKRKFSGYLLTGETPTDFIHADVPLTSESKRALDAELRDLLHYGKFVLRMRSEVPVTVMVKAVGEDGFEITDLVHPGWVSP